MKKQNKQRVEKVHEEYGTAEAYYSSNETVRTSMEGEWRDASQLTLPYIFPVDLKDQSSILPTPYNSIGPNAVNTLASKLLLALLPPTGVFFRLLPNQELTSKLDEKALKELDSDLSNLEQSVVEYINQKALRVPVYEAVKSLIVTGNSMLYKVPGGSLKVFSPYQYVVKRDYVGNVLTAAIKEKISIQALPEDIQKLIEDKEGTSHIQHEASEVAETDTKHIYTMIVREDMDKYKVWQEVDKIVIPNSEKTYTKATLPYIILRWTAVNNEDYGRGLVSQYLGDLRSLEGLTQTIVEGAGISAMHLFGLRPGSTLKVEDLNNAANGEFVLGDLEREVSTLQVNKGADLQVPLNLMAQLEQRLAKAFLMLSGQVRDSERTTATEVRATAAELESTLGGIFSVLAAEFQTPLITLILHELNPRVLKIAEPSVTTGVAAISRERDFQNLNTMLQSIAQLGPEVIAEYLDVPAYLKQVATSLGMDGEAIVKSKEQREAEQQQQMQQQQAMQQQEMQQQMQLDNNKAQGGK